MWDRIERRKNNNNQEHECPLSAEDAYQLIFEMKETRSKIAELNEKMDNICKRITLFERLYHEGKGVAIGVKLGGLAVISAIIGLAVLVWSAVTGKIQFSDIIKLF